MTMGYAVELFLNADESKAIRRLFSTTGSVLADIGTTPHITLAVFKDIDLAKLEPIVHSLAESVAAFRIRFSSVGLFPGEDNVVFLAPVVTSALLELHGALHVRLQAAGMSSDPYYLPEAWVPHCAITTEEPAVQSLETIRQVCDANVLGDYTVEDIHVVRFRPVVTLTSFRLTALASERGDRDAH
jgi:2'-5' RNA ligase